MKRLLTILLLLMISFGASAQSYLPYLNGQWKRIKVDSLFTLPRLSTGNGVQDGDFRYNPSTSKAQLWYSSAWNNMASETYVTSNTAPSSGGTNYIWNGTSAQSASWHITGQATIAGTNPYKMFLTRANMTQNAVLAFKNGSDTAGYVGLGSLLNNEIMMVGKKTNRAGIRTLDTARIVFGSHTPEFSYVVGKKGRWRFGDSVLIDPDRYVIEINRNVSGDTSLWASGKVLGHGVISNGTLSVDGVSTFNAAFSPQITTVSTGTTLGDAHFTAVGNTAAGACTINLPTGAAFNERMYFIRRSSTANTLTLNTTGGDTYPDGSVTMSVTNAVIVQLQGTTWWILAQF